MLRTYTDAYADSAATVIKSVNRDWSHGIRLRFWASWRANAANRGRGGLAAGGGPPRTMPFMISRA